MCSKFLPERCEFLQRQPLIGQQLFAQSRKIFGNPLPRSSSLIELSKPRALLEKQGREAGNTGRFGLPDPLGD